MTGESIIESWMSIPKDLLEHLTSWTGGGAITKPLSNALKHLTSWGQEEKKEEPPKPPAYP